VVNRLERNFWLSGSGNEHEHNTWESEKHLTHCEDLHADYWANVATSPQGVREKQAELRKKRKTAELERNRSVEQNASEPASRKESAYKTSMKSSNGGLMLAHRKGIKRKCVYN
jgi:hypothetical protein